MGREKRQRWRTITRAGILLGFALLIAGLIVRDIRSRGFVQADYLALGLWIAGAALAVGGMVLNWRMLVDLVRHRRAAEGFNIALVIALSIALTALLCYISTRRYARMDWTGTRKYQLHSKTENILRSLDRDVEVTVLYFFTDNPALDQETNLWLRTTLDMLEEFKAISRHVSLRDLNWPLAQNQQRVQQLRQRLAGDDPPPRGVVFVTSDSHQIVPFDKTIQVSLAYGRPGFTGEDAFATALTKLTEMEKITLYALTGHGERPLEPEAAGPAERQNAGLMSDPRFSLSRVVKALRADNYEVKPLNLSVEGTVPEDCAALLIAGPKAPLSEAEIKAIGDYLENRDGRAIVMIDPEAVSGAATNVNELISDYGIRAHTDAVGLSNRPWIVGVMQSADVPVAADGFADHPITADLHNYSLLVQFACPLEVVERRPQPTLKTSELLTGIESSWGERNYQADSTTVAEYQAGQDVAPPVVVAVVAQPVPPPQVYPIQQPSDEDLPGPRVVVFGSSLCFVNAAVEQQPAYRYLLLNTVNWMAGKMHMLGIPAKTLEFNVVSVSDSQILAARYIFIGILPGCIIALGIGVWLIRRR